MPSGDVLYTWNPAANEPPTSTAATFSIRNNRLVLAFATGSNQVAVFSGYIPTHYNDSGYVVRIIWASTGTTGDVDWDINFEKLEANDLDLDSDSFSSTTSSNDNTVNATSGKLTYTDIQVGAGTASDDVAAGDYFRLKITRDAASDASSDTIQIFQVVLKEL